ncbi:MAG: hypothetical protein M0R03_16320 [Novosphingobium sp.]|nr:hypothetical protein [Novosphingobium sp.]
MTREFIKNVIPTELGEVKPFSQVLSSTLSTRKDEFKLTTKLLASLIRKANLAKKQSELVIQFSNYTVTCHIEEKI